MLGRNLLIGLLGLMAGSGCQSTTCSTECGTTGGGDIVQLAPDQVSVAFENEMVRALVFELAPGRELPLHEGSDRVVYALSDFSLEWLEMGSTSKTKNWKAGQSHWHSGGAHTARNVGTTPARFLIVERSSKPLPAARAHHKGTGEHSPSHGKLAFENEAVKVAEVVLPPGKSTLRHESGHRMIYSLSDYIIRWTESDAASTTKSWSKGDAHWHGPAANVVENIGDTTARFLVFTWLR